MSKILVVDDDTDILEVVKLMLEIEGYEVMVLDNPHIIIDAVNNFKPNLLILDVMLGDIDGRDVCHHLKNKSDTKHIPILMFSAVHDFSSIMENNCNADGYISKPFDMNHLLGKVRDLIH